MSEVILAPWKSIMMARLKSGRITSFRQSLGLERDRLAVRHSPAKGLGRINAASEMAGNFFKLNRFSRS